MKEPAVKFALIFAVMTAAFKVAAFNYFPEGQAPKATVMAYLYGSIMAITLAFKAVQVPGEPPLFLQNIKDALRPALLFAIFVALFAYVYHGVINPEYMENRKVEMMADAEVQWETQYKDHPAYKSITKETYLENQQKAAETMNKPFLHATFSLVGFFMFGVGFSILIIMLYRRVPVFRKGLGG